VQDLTFLLVVFLCKQGGSSCCLPFDDLCPTDCHALHKDCETGCH
jgi:hypothetical protein